MPLLRLLAAIDAAAFASRRFAPAGYAARYAPLMLPLRLIDRFLLQRYASLPLALISFSFGFFTPRHAFRLSYFSSPAPFHLFHFRD